MAIFRNLQSNRPGGDTFSNDFATPLQTALTNIQGSITTNMGLLLEDLATLDSDTFMAGGLQTSTRSSLRYFPSGSLTDNSRGVIEVAGKNLPIYSAATGGFDDGVAGAGITFTRVSYTNLARNNQAIEFTGQFTNTPYTLKVGPETKNLEQTSFRLESLSFGSDLFRVTLTGTLNIQGQKAVVKNGQFVENDAKVSGSLSGITIQMTDTDGSQYRLEAKGALNPMGTSSFNSVVISKTGDVAYGFSATSIGMFFNSEGLLSNAKGVAAGGDDTDYIFRGNDQITGTSGEDDLGGYAGNDTLNGGNGADILSGGDGRDRLSGGGGNDIFAFDSVPSKINLDTITDFAAGELLALDRTDFSAIVSAIGTLAAAEFQSGARLKSATLAATRIVYDTSTGTVYYDADGVGGVAAVAVAVIGTKPTLTAANIIVFEDRLFTG